jgi:hypothetical protein
MSKSTPSSWLRIGYWRSRSGQGQLYGLGGQRARGLLDTRANCFPRAGAFAFALSIQGRKRIHNADEPWCGDHRQARLSNVFERVIRRRARALAILHFAETATCFQSFIRASACSITQSIARLYKASFAHSLGGANFGRTKICPVVFDIHEDCLFRMHTTVRARIAQLAVPQQSFPTRAGSKEGGGIPPSARRIAPSSIIKALHFVYDR